MIAQESFNSVLLIHVDGPCSSGMNAKSIVDAAYERECCVIEAARFVDCYDNGAAHFGGSGVAIVSLGTGIHLKTLYGSFW